MLYFFRPFKSSNGLSLQSIKLLEQPLNSSFGLNYFNGKNSSNYFLSSHLFDLKVDLKLELEFSILWLEQTCPFFSARKFWEIFGHFKHVTKSITLTKLPLYPERPFFSKLNHPFFFFTAYLAQFVQVPLMDFHFQA